MDHPERPTTYRRLRTPRPVRRDHPGFHAFIGFCTTLLGYVLLTSGAHAPAYGSVVAPEVSTKVASLTRHGTDVMITGSVQSLFDAPGLTGPNRAEKVNRARPTPAPLEFVASFSEARMQLASLRAGAFNEDAIPAVQVAAAPVTPLPPQPAATAVPRVAVASLGPAPATPALIAIENIAPGPGAPLPLVLSDELAYARAEAPVTSFATQPVDAKGKAVSEKDLWCMSEAVYFEARGESYKGQVAVAQVVLNRLHHRLYPKTIAAWCSKTSRCATPASSHSRAMASRACHRCGRLEAGPGDRQGRDRRSVSGRGGKATHYHAAYVYPDWAPRMKKVTRIGLHIFYQFKRNWKYG